MVEKGCSKGACAIIAGLAKSRANTHAVPASDERFIDLSFCFRATAVADSGPAIKCLVSGY
jgi:hypothetical protein